jgi:uncharacterized protein
MPVSAERLCTWHAGPRALEVLIPPGEPVRLLHRSGGIEDGAVTVFAIGYGPFRIQWVAVHRDYIPGRQFRDEQVKGPFAHWVHTHRFEPAGEGASYLEDHVEYALPLAWLTEPLVGGLVRRRLEAMFQYRHAVTLREVTA